MEDYQQEDNSIPPDLAKALGREAIQVMWHSLEAQRETLLKEGRFLLSPVLLTHTQNLKLQFTFYQKRKVDVILLSLKATGLNSMSEQLT